jgi:carboxymethylenebutenolidase
MKDQSSRDSQDAACLSRREFTAWSLAAGLGAAAGSPGALAAASASDQDVSIQTPAGVCDAALIHPDGAVDGRRSWPAAILFPDVFGLRPTMREMARRLAANGYTVLVPNPFYRSTRAPGITPGFDFQNPQDRARLEALRAPLTNEGVGQDATAYVGFLDSQSVVDRKAPIGVFGYCMGGPMTIQAAAAVPARIRAGASFHGGGLVTDKPDSPHLLVPRLKGRYYFAIAANDDARQPDAKDKLTEAFAAAHVPAKVEVYPGTLHGWCVKDMPTERGKPIYNEPQAERAWAELTSLFRTLQTSA